MARVPRLSTTLSTTLTAGSAISTRLGHHHLEFARFEVFGAQQDLVFPVMSTSPMPRLTNVVVAPRAPESSTGTSCTARPRTLAPSLRRLWWRRPPRGRAPWRDPRARVSKHNPKRRGSSSQRPGRLGIRCDHRDARFHQVVPVANVLGIALRTRKTMVEGKALAWLGRRFCQSCGKSLARSAIMSMSRPSPA